jgi:hypothetical protein
MQIDRSFLRFATTCGITARLGIYIPLNQDTES